MADSLFARLRNAWDVFSKSESNEKKYHYSNPMRPIPSEIAGTRAHFRSGVATTKSIVSSIYTRIGIDVSGVDIRHAQLGQNKQFLSEVNSGLNRCLMIDPNLDQSARAFKQDLTMSLLEKGHVCVVPVDTAGDISKGNYDILSLRVGEVIEWFADHVEVRLYNQRRGVNQDIILPKSEVALIENPFYSVMNQPNSTVQRLLRKLYLLDVIDEQIGSSKLDIIIQLPYVVRSDAKREQAEARRKDIEMQLKDASYGIAYTDGVERIIQLNRPAENNMLKQVEYLTNKLYAELGMTPEVIAGTASEQVMLNYFNSTIEPILQAITEEFSRKFLTLQKYNSGQSIKAMRNPFNLVPIANIAEMADKFTRNEILTSNEFRGVIGYYPSDDPKADELRNANISAPKEEAAPAPKSSEDKETDEKASDKSTETKKLPAKDRKEILSILLKSGKDVPMSDILKEKE